MPEIPGEKATRSEVGAAGEGTEVVRGIGRGSGGSGSG